MREVNFYRTQTGDCPVKEFLDSLSGKQAQKIVWVLGLFEELEIVPGQHFKKLVNTDSIWEVRVNLGNNTFRLLGFLSGEQLILTNGFAKKTQKTPSSEIALAAQRKQDYFNQDET